MTIQEIANALNIKIGTIDALKMYIGSAVVWEPQVSAIYDAEIEYLESTGTQYINTNCQVTNVGVSGEIIMQRTGSSGSELCYIGRTVLGGFDIQTDSNRGISLWVDGMGYVSSGNTYFDTIKHTVTFSIESNSTNLSVDGNQYSVSGTPTSPTIADIQIFSHNSSYRSQGRIYSCKIYNNGILSLDLIPVRIGQVGYMYNKVSGQLFGNNGTGSFILGPDKLPKEYTELEYISSTSGGNQYIDLGIKLYETLNTNYDIAMKFNIASGNANQAALFACQDSDNDPWPGTFVRVNSSAGSVVGRYIGGTAKDNTIGSVGSDLELPVQMAPNKNVTSLNNSNNITHQYGTSLFCAFVGGTNTPARYCNAKLYYFKLFVNGTLVRDLIPCKNSSDVVGMYDLVNRVFYTSPNNAAFVAGPEVITDVPSSYSLLDILYSDSSGNLSVDSQVLPTSEGKIPIALCIAGTNFFGDNEPARWMSLKYMSNDTPDSGSLTANGSAMAWGNKGLDISTIDDITTTYNGGTDSGYLTSDWIWVTDAKIPSLFDANDEWNLSVLGAKNNYAVTDVDGKNKTAKMLETATAQSTWQTDTTITNSQSQRYSPAACCCWRYHTLGTQQGDWYLTACGELCMIVVNKPRINSKLSSINALYPNDCMSVFAGSHYLTSTEIDSSRVFKVVGDNGNVGIRGKYDNSAVIALIQY